MKNFEMRCPFDGTSALQPEFNRVSAAGAIIEFPGSGSQGACAPLQHSHARQVPSAACCARRLGATEMARVLRHGSAAGRAYGRVRPWQGALAGCVFSVFAFLSIFISF